VLKGEKGKRIVRKISPGVYAPIEGSEIDPENGKDIITTIDVNIQDIAENALLKVLMENECEYGTAVVMDVKTGKIKAMAISEEERMAVIGKISTTRSAPRSRVPLLNWQRCWHCWRINI
jgi:cell division protein FtsI/penicillin-binding protein 2